jgi:hypothetical protein
MTAPPLCRYCGKPLAKHTVPHWIGRDDPDPPICKEECQQRAGNLQVVSVRYGGSWHGNPDVRQVEFYSTWDGESYLRVAGHFCTNDHAIRFAGLFAREGKATSDYVAALVKQREQLKAE